MRSKFLLTTITIFWSLLSLASTPQWTSEYNGYSTFKLYRGAETFAFCNQVDFPRVNSRDFNSKTKFSTNDNGFEIICGRSNEFIQFQMCTDKDCQRSDTKVVKLADRPYSYKMVRKEYSATIVGEKALQLKRYMGRIRDQYFETGVDNVSQISINCGLPDSCEIEFILVTESK